MSLQKKLESKGWTFLGNHSVADHDLNSGFAGIAQFGNRTEVVPTSYQLKKQLEKKYEKVKLKQPYDTEGNSMNALQFKAVYVKDKK